MSDNLRSGDYFEDTAVGTVEKTVTIKPGSGKAVGLGVYKSTVKDPEVKVTCQPELHGDMGISAEHLEIPGKSKYILLYQFQNFSQKSCRVTMHLHGNNSVAS